MNQLNLYHIFYTVAGCGNISAAAKKLYISQPAVSKAISKLEGNYASPLLIRTSKGVQLTENGQVLYKQLETAFQAIRQGEEMIQKNDYLGMGRLSLGASTTLCKYVLLPYLQEFIAENPHVKVAISCQSTYETLAALENGGLNLGLVGDCERLEHGNLQFYPLKTIQDTFVCSPEYLKKLKERAGDTQDDKALLSHATFLLLNKDNVTRQYMDKYMLLRDIVLEHQIEVTTMDLLIDFAKIGLGIACVIRDFVDEELKNGSLVEITIKEPLPPRKIGFVYSKSMKPSGAMEKFLGKIKLLFPGNGPYSGGGK